MSVATARKPASKRKPGKPKMTAEQARTFTAKSLHSFMAVEATLAARNLEDEQFAECGCEAYRDVFTFNRWLAQGMVVQKGQSSMRHIAWIETGRSNEVTSEQGEQENKPVLRPTTTYLFCKCQVAASQPKEGK